MRIVGIGLSVMALALVVGCSGPNGAAELQQAGEAYKAYVLPPLGDGPPIITLAEYDQLQDGMSYAAVSKIVQGEGKLLREQEHGVTGIKMLTYEWLNDDRSQATITFAGDKLVTKSQSGLN